MNSVCIIGRLVKDLLQKEGFQAIQDIVERSRKEKAVLEKLAKYEDMEEQGLLIKLPCKVGDTVYEIKWTTR